MPKTNKRTESRRAAKIAKAHATAAPQSNRTEREERRHPVGYKAPARGIARYPWASIIILCLIIVAAALIAYSYTHHVGPFAPHAKPKATPTVTPKTTPTVTPTTTTTPTVTPTATPQSRTTGSSAGLAASAPQTPYLVTSFTYQVHNG
ncbi:MAG TPA: hypothetical protein VL461_00155 [Dictyobacter sp.]|jgi:hypothetical protein|nr:hypothetical protein [Dictyobacter sp.]